jgi:hypothetical protein
MRSAFDEGALSMPDFIFNEVSPLVGVAIEEIDCIFCNNDIEVEMHFVLKCHRYQGLRSHFIKPYYWRKSSVYRNIIKPLLHSKDIICLV